MTIDSSVRNAFETKLATGDLTVTARDVELLEAISDHGSIHAAANALERSYSHAQRRIVELEDAIGPLVDRQRGGVEGGGSTLTTTAQELLRQFTRLEVAFSGCTEVNITVLDGEVIDRTGELGIVETAAGRVHALIAAETDSVEVTIRADTITLIDPADAPPANDTSARNQLSGTIREIDIRGSVGRVTIDIGAETPLVAMITRSSYERLGLEASQAIVASFKATATRATAWNVAS